MRFRKIGVMALTLVLLAAALVVWRLEPEGAAAEERGSPFSVLVFSEGETEEIRCWWKEEDKYYVFLPSYAELSQTQVRLSAGSDVRIGGAELTDGMTCEGFEQNVYLEFAFTEDGVERNGVVTFLQSGKVATMYIDVRSGNMDYIHAAKGNEEPGMIHLYNSDGALEYTGSVESIKGRGNATWDNAEKKPYSLNLAAEADLLGMGAAQKWILMANAFDYSHIRNKMVFDYADAVGLEYSPDANWVDLYLNGEYAGLYLLSERNEIHEERVAAAENGSMLVSIEMEERLIKQNYPHIVVDSGTALRVHSAEKVTENMISFWQSVNDAIIAEDGIDPATGKSWLELIDLDSWVRKYLVEEIFANVDAGSVSQYFYVDGDDPEQKVYAGPVWDYDFAMGSSRTWVTPFVQAFFANKTYIWDESNHPWFHALCQKEEFYQRMTELYETEFRPAMVELLETGMAEYTAQVEQAAEMNKRRWSVAEASEDTAQIREYLTRRLEFLDSLWIAEDTYYTVVANRKDGSIVGNFAVRPGECVPELPDPAYEEGGVGWYYLDTDEPFDPAQPIYEDTEIYLKRESSAEAEAGMLQKLLWYAPPAVLAMLLATVWGFDKFRRKRNDGWKHERCEDEVSV